MAKLPRKPRVTASTEATETPTQAPETTVAPTTETPTMDTQTPETTPEQSDVTPTPSVEAPIRAGDETAPILQVDESPHLPEEVVQAVEAAIRTTPQTIEEYLRSIGMVEAPRFPEPFFSWVQTIREYEKNMAPNVPSSIQVQSKSQRSLYTLILSILNSPTNLSVQGMNMLLFWILKNKNKMFRSEYVFRTSGARMNAQETILFQEIVTFLIAAAEPATRKLVTRQFSLSRIMNGLPTPEAQQNFGYCFS